MVPWLVVSWVEVGGGFVVVDWLGLVENVGRGWLRPWVCVVG